MPMPLPVRFGLKTFLVFVLLVAVPCGFAGRELVHRRAIKRQQDEVTTAVQKAGGSVRYHYWPHRYKPILLRWYSDQELFRTLESIPDHV